MTETFTLMMMLIYSFISAPQLIEIHLSQFQYEWDREPGCISYTVEEFYEHNGGVCLDFAFYSAHLLDQVGIQPYEITYCYNFECTEVHAITAFEWDGAWWKYDNWVLMGPYDDLMATFWPHVKYTIVNDAVRNFCFIF